MLWTKSPHTRSSTRLTPVDASMALCRRRAPSRRARCRVRTPRRPSRASHPAAHLGCARTRVVPTDLLRYSANRHRDRSQHSATSQHQLPALWGTAWRQRRPCPFMTWSNATPDLRRASRARIPRLQGYAWIGIITPQQTSIWIGTVRGRKPLLHGKCPMHERAALGRTRSMRRNRALMPVHLRQSSSPMVSLPFEGRRL